MKKKDFVCALAVVAAVATVTPSFSQTSKGSLQSNPSTLMNSSKMMLAGEESDKAAVEKLKLINVRLHKDFTRFFRDAADIKIADTKNGTFISCKMNGIPNRVLYNDKGRWMHTIRYLSASNIPAHVLETVRSEFPKFNILNATEVKVGNRTAHLVNIDNVNSYKVIRVVDDEWDIYKEFSK